MTPTNLYVQSTQAIYLMRHKGRKTAILTRGGRSYAYNERSGYGGNMGFTSGRYSLGGAAGRLYRLAIRSAHYVYPYSIYGN